MKIKAGDTVEVIAGNDKGTRGTVRVAIPKEKRVIVSGVKLIKKAQRRTANMRTEPGIVQLEAPVNVSNVMLVCPHCDKPTRVGTQETESGRVRVCRKCHEVID
ncbi:MAG: 50S ribosomal protein L24 [Anaerolineae bacterium]|jgi:large subunit ribosomal protein L24|nr:50S ribosomal protein L24 [Chloroflexota bacterium]